MIAVDTNIIVRLLTQDDPKQYKKAHNLFQSEQIYIPLTVIQETEWVLRYAYQFKPDDIHQALLGLAGLANVIVEQPHSVLQALRGLQHGMDFSDALHLAQSKRCNRFFTFDKKLCHKAHGQSSCPVVVP